MNSPVLHDIAGFILIFSAILLTAGIIRPMIVVWWTNHKTRSKVLMVYGSLVLVSAVIFMVTSDAENDGRKDPTTNKQQTQQETGEGGDANQ